MNLESIFLLQFLLSLATWSAIAAFLAAPWLSTLPRRDALTWLAVPHAFRHIGMVFLVPGVVYQPLPESFSIPAAYGDLAAGILALMAIVALRRRWVFAIALVWSFNIVGAVDLVRALSQTGVVPLFGATWYIPTMLVPLLLVTHAMSFWLLISKRAERDPVESGASGIPVA